jgi:hypothetical protein
MIFDILKTRRGKLIHNLKTEIKNPVPSIDNVLKLIDDYEKNNLDTISKLKKDRLFETKRISGALKQTINAHGPITNILIGSATKRIYGALLSNGSKTYNHYVKVHKATLMLGGVILIALLASIFLIN